MKNQQVGNPTAPEAPPGATPGRGLLPRRPGALGLGVAVLLLATGVADRDTLAIGVVAAALCYLAAAALGRPWVAWASIPGASLVAVAGEVSGLSRWAALGLAALVVAAVGVVRGAGRPTLTQGAALVGFGTLAVVALSLPPQAGLVLAALALAGHGVWDVIHHRRNEVVPRSMAEACLLFDVALGLGCIAIALAG